MCFRFRIDLHVRGNDCCWLRICSRQSNNPPRLGPQCMPRFETRCCTCTVMRFCRREVLVIHTRVVFSTIAGARQASAWTHKRVRFRGVRASSAQWTADTKWEWEPEWVAAGARSRATHFSLQRSFHSAQDQCTVYGPVLRIIALIVLSVWILELLIADYSTPVELHHFSRLSRFSKRHIRRTGSWFCWESCSPQSNAVADPTSRRSKC